MAFQSELKGRDLLKAKDFDVSGLELIVCTETQSLVHSMTEKFGQDLRKWEMPEGNSHGEILLRELLMKINDQWKFPYPHEELCHCRKVMAFDVDQAIIAGAHTTEQVSRRTMAGTGCGTCRTDTESLLKYRLANSETKGPKETPNA